MSAKDASIDIFNNLSHHANLLIGTADMRDEIVSILEKKHGLAAQGNPDFYIRNFETLIIDDARELKALHASRPVDGEKKIFVLTMNGITIEAQNALLKLLEEPAEYAHFFLVIPSAHLLLPTVKSRMQEVDFSMINDQYPDRVNEKQTELMKEAGAFLKANQTKRLDIVKKLTEEISKEKKTKQDAIIFLDAVQKIVYQEQGVTQGRPALRAIEKARDYMNDRAPSIKMLLEYVALSA